ncbi:MAG: 50S ribosomal protein L4 [bacterium]
MKFDVYNIEGDKVGKVEVSDVLFAESLRKELIHFVATVQLANMRRGTASVKTRGEVRGGGRKPWRQKGTGRARHGSTRSPIWVGGGVVFGPKPRSYRKNIPKKMKRKALRSIISSRASDNAITVVDELPINEFKTKWVVEVLKKLNLYEKKLLMVTNGYNDHLFKSSDNIPNVKILSADRLNVYDILTTEHILFTQEGIKRAGEVFG